MDRAELHYSWKVGGYQTFLRWPTPEKALSDAYEHNPNATEVTIISEPAVHDRQHALRTPGSRW